MKRYVLTVAYDGTDYCGWQIQSNGITVQQRMQEAVFSAFGVKTTVTASGRTDAGVHALGQVCHVDLPADMAGERVADALNPHLPDDISVLSSCAAPVGFDANRSAKKKTYRYDVYFSSRRNPLLDRYAAQTKGEKNVEKLNEALSLFVGVHDFSAYCASGSQVRTTVREVYNAYAEENADGTVSLYVCGNGFLYNMVRTIAGTAIAYSQGRTDRERIGQSLSSGDRSLVGKTMPPRGLTLVSVEYDN